MNNSNKIITYNYKFEFSDGTEKEFDIKLDSKTLDLIQSEKKSFPAWAELNFFKCPNCPLNERQHGFCPIAVNLLDVVDAFKGRVSHEEVDVSIITNDRTYIKHTSLQKGLSSMIGIYMVTSGCPVMEKLKPMVRHHLPFATEEETKYRAIAMYLMAQYFLSKHSEKPDWGLKNLSDIYADVRTVNNAFCQRLSNIQTKDASINALVILDCFAGSVRFSISKDMMDEIEIIFKAYLR